MTGSSGTLAPEDKFWDRTELQANGCLLWLGPVNAEGYGTFYLGHDTWVGVHRYAYERFVGPIPEGLTIDHLCRNRSCANPAHLEPVTMRENVMRGDGITARNAHKTHCDSGHEFSDTNTYIRKNGHRACRACARRRDQGRRSTEARLQRDREILLRDTMDALAHSESVGWIIDENEYGELLARFRDLVERAG